MGLYLLIWGEAANVRFMPECLCYIFHNVSFFFIFIFFFIYLFIFFFIFCRVYDLFLLLNTVPENLLIYSLNIIVFYILYN